MRFTNAYAASPFCSPTRASIMTGLDPARIGITSPGAHMPTPVLRKGLRRRREQKPMRTAETVNRLDPAYETLAERFREAGYATAHFGKWHLGFPRPYEPRDHGFDVVWPNTPRDAGPPGDYFAPWNTDSDPSLVGEPGEHIDVRIAAEIERFIDEHRERPFFVNFWTFSVHAPWRTRPEYLERHQRRVDPTDEQRNPVYAGMMESLDEAVGRVLDAIANSGLSQQTIVVFSSDNGGMAVAPDIFFEPPEYAAVPTTSNAPLRAGKGSLYEGGTRVPLIVVWPGRVDEGVVTDALVSSTDLYPTLLEMAGSAVPESTGLDGLSQVSTLLGGAPPRRSVFWHLPHGGPKAESRNEGSWPSSAIRSGHWKLIRRYGANRDGSDQQLLYDLAADVGETRDLARVQPAVAGALAQELDRWLRDTEAVIPVPNPGYRQAGRRRSRSASP
jgi:arylsulfatase A-like enzyme